MAANKNIKDQLLEKTAEELGQPLVVVEDVMRWVFKDMTKAFKIHIQVEMSGFGTFLVSPAKLRRRIEKLERMEGGLEAQPQSELRDEKLRQIRESLQYYYLKTNEFKETIPANRRGVQESMDSFRENEGGNREGELGETGNMQGVS